MKVGSSRNIQFGAAALALMVTACGSSGSVAPTLIPRTSAEPTASSGGAASSTAGPSATLDGSWDTGPYATTAYAGHTQWEVKVTFYAENGVPFVSMTGWDPTEGAPGDGDHGPYHLLPNSQIGIASADQPQFSTVYAYTLSGDNLTLTWLHNDPNGPDAADTSGPFTTIELHRQP